MLRLSVFAVLFVSACGIVQNKCETTSVDKELEDVEQMIAETHANLDRGYAIHNAGGSLGVSFCAGNRSSNIGISFCTSPTRRAGETPIAIDTAAERRKLRALEARRIELDDRAALEKAACRQEQSA